jgi:hypothetical protein
MRYRVRSLSTVGPGVVDRSDHGHGAAGVFNHMSDQAGAVFEIQAEELAHGKAGGEALMRNAKYIVMGIAATALAFGYALLRALARH